MIPLFKTILSIISSYRNLYFFFKNLMMLGYVLLGLLSLTQAIYIEITNEEFCFNLTKLEKGTYKLFYECFEDDCAVHVSIKN